jgi:hypothetical protein
LIRNGHLDDAALAGIWTAAAIGETASDSHLIACAECRARYEDLRAWLESMRAEAVDEADGAFPAERLAAQQANILRRLEAAAAAGLVIGVALGQWMDLRHRFGPQPGRTADQMVASAPAPSSDMVLQTAGSLSDDALLMELDATISMHPSVGPLRAIDTITPRSRDFLDQAR